MKIRFRCSCGAEVELDTDSGLSFSEAMLIQKEWREEHKGCLREEPKRIKQYKAWESRDGLILLTEYTDGTYWLRDKLASLPSRSSDIPLTLYR